MISRRADINASRWRVEAAERNLESARTEFFPDVTINALAGLSSIDVGKLIEYGSRVPQASAARISRVQFHRCIVNPISFSPRREYR